MKKMRPKHFGIITRDTIKHAKAKRKKKKLYFFSAQEEIHSCFIFDLVNVKLPLGSLVDLTLPPTPPSLTQTAQKKRKKKKGLSSLGGVLPARAPGRRQMTE